LTGLLDADMCDRIPQTQHAVQLVGPDRLSTITDKPVPLPGPHQILCRVEAVGLCFSDLKLVKQFADHPRKSEIISGLDQETLAQIPSYVPGGRATVCGHEAAVRIAAVGEQVPALQPGERYVVQTDYRWLRTAKANAAFGYNFEGALQEYVLLDQRAITSPGGELMLLPASEAMSASALALVEPWACVEDAYAEKQRQTLKPGGRMLVIVEPGLPQTAIGNLLATSGAPGELVCVGTAAVPDNLGIALMRAAAVEHLPSTSFDDLVYFGANADTLESVLPKAAPHGLVNIALCGGRFGRPVAVPVGRVHYSGIRIVGTVGSDPTASMHAIPASGEIRSGDRIHVVGAGGPMGMMHVVRSLCRGVPSIQVHAADLDPRRLASLQRVAAPLAERNGLAFDAFDPADSEAQRPFDYVVLLVPAPELVARAVGLADANAIINIFAGIPGDVTAQLDLDTYIEKQLYLLGTSGSALDDMRFVLAKAESGELDTDLSVAAISGLGGAAEGIRSIERREIPGKVIVYPWCKSLELVTLDGLAARLPTVARRLHEGRWNRKAEDALRQTCAAVDGQL
jgi:threonine dehydrogenase-like Zn-dependent dehydrogenase